MPSRVRFALPSFLALIPALALSGELVTAAPVVVPAAAVSWPPATGVLLSEVATGGATASDEFVELYNAAPSPVDLASLELAYISASGATITRKASWPGGQVLLPGQHLLAANAAGAYASAADTAYSGGLAATGGALVLRVAGGAVVDAVGWGDATNAFVEGSAAPAPAAGASIERLPGGDLGGAQDSNDNASDWVARAEPNPQGLLDPPLPIATPAGPTTVSPTVGQTTSATPTPEPPTTASPSPTLAPTSTASPSVVGTPAPSPTERPTPIAAARGLPPGSSAMVEGVLTVPLGLVDDGRGAFVEDESGGAALYLDSGAWPAAPAGSVVRVRGTLDQRYAQTTIRVASPGDLALVGAGALPEPVEASTGGAGETMEGLLVRASGRIVAGPDALSDGFAVDLDDGSGSLRVVAPAASAIAADALRRGSTVTLVGPLGQRDSSGSGTAGYRLYLRSPAVITALVPPSPTPSGGASPSTPTATGIATPTPTASASGGTSASPSADGIVSIASLLARPGARVRVVGTVTSPSSTWGVDGRRVTIEDPSGAILLRLPSGVRPAGVGQRLDVHGRVGHYLGAPQLEAEAAPARLGSGGVSPRAIGHGPLGSAWTWRLAIAVGRVLEARHGATSWRAELQLSDGSRLPVGGGLSALGAGRRVVVGARLAVTGIVRPPASGASDRRRYLVARSASDVALVRAAAPGGSPTGGDSGGSSGGAVAASAAPGAPVEVDLADLADHDGRLVRAGGVVVDIAPASLRVDDGTAQALVRSEPGARANSTAPPLDVPLGAVVNVVGTVAEGDDGWEIHLRTAADLTVAAGLDPSAAPSATPPPADGSTVYGAGSTEADARSAGLNSLLPVGFASLAGLGMATLLLGWQLRRRRAAKVAERVGARLAALAEPTVPADRTSVRP
ncbi:MAG TPA: lamin tail domain-containing protein [Candidatus Dormibacteraeota bacterium]|nr:lamin tail domain-containing protein [Candidatus Dormibacteraeota bacterium]